MATNSKDANEEKFRRKRRNELTSLSKEMEVAQYMGKTSNGQLRKRITRKEAMVQSKKRKLLEKEDLDELAIVGEKSAGRIRGSKAAIEDHVIQGSLVFQPAKPKARRSMRLQEKHDAEQYEEEEDQTFEEEESDMGSDVEYDEDMEVFSENDEDDDDQGEDAVDTDTAATRRDHAEGDNAENEDDVFDPVARPKKRNRSRPSKRRMYKLRNFRSFRMAQRHGDALAAHARGQPRLAIQKLKQVARDAPSAPQIYSSLGMVYEDMLKECRNRADQSTFQPSTTEETPKETKTSMDTAEADSTEKYFPDPNLAEQCDLAKKAYGSYHAAGILCKKDFALWVRAADAACEIANIHSKTGALPNQSPEHRLYHRNEKKRWLLEAQRDFTAADKLEPPGIDVPGKLAAVHMDLGNLSEALTILTDLKNRRSNQLGKRTEFHSSYKAWILYSDLMLRIGHECIEWNRGVQTNDNYMFRRWLRKLSKKFDWQERRLQGLCLALEAAAGSKSTAALFDWMRERLIISKPQTHEEPEADADRDRWHLESMTDPASKPNITPAKTAIGSGSTAVTEDLQKEDAKSQPAKCLETTESSSAKAKRKDDTASHAPTRAQFEQEKRIAREKNQAELNDFDKTTADMSLDPNSLAAKDRDTTRQSLVKAHEEALSTLAGEYTGEKGSDTLALGNSTDDDEAKIIGIDEPPLPVSASCKQVCSIASELMKHLHGLKLYAGVRIVGEAVSKYFVARASIRDKRMDRRRKLEEWEQTLARNPLLIEPYDQNSDGSDSEDDDASTFLSDESDVENDDNLELLESLRRGVLPPELRVLYGLALIGEGGRNFVAAKCIAAIDTLEQESSTWLSDGEGETEASGNPLWELFRRAMTEPLGRTSAYAFLADVLRKTAKEHEWAPHFSQWFRRHNETLRKVGLSESLLRLEGKVSSYTNFRKNQLLKIILASIRFDIWTAQTPERRNPVNRKPLNIDDSTCIENVVSAISSLADVVHLVWKVEQDGSIPQICAEVVRVSAKCLRWISKMAVDKLSYSSLNKIVENSIVVISFLCRNPVTGLRQTDKTTKLSDMQWAEFPVEASWQENDHRPLSLSVYNLSIACNVSLFSGWEPEEFTLKLLRRRHGHRHFGIHIHDKRVTGFLPPVLETEVATQWTKMSSLIPSFPKLEFLEKVAVVKEQEWYGDEVENRRRANASTPIARYAEDDGIALYLAFSSLCLRLAESEGDEAVRNQLLKISLSIILPVSQFCVNESLWTSDIGEAAGSLIGFEEWRLMPGRGPEAFTGKDEYKKPSRWKRRVEKRIEKKVQAWLKGTGKPTLHSFVTIPTHIMKTTWKASIGTAAEGSTETAKKCMEEVDRVTKELRGCYTETACEKVSLQLALALLELAAQPACHDPFTCLQHAAMFASQATKAGMSDVVFRKSIPEVQNCTPQEALSVLGRADCLHAIYFPNEAAFLCSFVARACRLHRDRGQPDYEWNSLWKIVAIYAYNVSVMIRTSVSTVLNKQMQKSFHAMWERDVVEELERGRSDGWAWKRNLSIKDPDADIQQGDSDSEEIENTIVNENASSDEEADDDSDDNEGDHDGDNEGVETFQATSYEDEPFFIEAHYPQPAEEEFAASSYDFPYGNPFANLFLDTTPTTNPPATTQHSDDFDDIGYDEVEAVAV